MATITEIRWKGEERARGRVYLDGAYWLSAAADELERAGIVEGAELGDPEATARMLQLEAAKAYLLRSLGARAQSERELARKLERRGTAPEVAAEALAFTREYGFVDDETLARRVCEDVRSRGYGAGRAAETLRRRGVAREIAEAAIAAVFAADDDGGGDEVERAKQALGSRYALPEERQKAFAFLCRRGFSIDVARQAVAADEE